MENIYLSIDNTKIGNNSKQTKMSRTDVMQLATSNNNSRAIDPKPFPQSVRFWQGFYYLRKRLYLLGHFENGFHFLSINKAS